MKNRRGSKPFLTSLGRIMIAAFLLVGFSAFLLQRLFAHEGEEHATAEPAQVATTASAAAEIPITKEQQFALGMLTEPATTRELSRPIELTGRVIPRTDAIADVVPPVPGRVIGVVPRLGQHVSRGDLLFRIEQVLAPSERASLRAEQIRAKADLASAEREIARLERLEGVVAGKQLTEAHIRRDAAKETYDAITAQLTGAGATVPVTAPISGEIIVADAVSGEVVDGSKTIYRIADLSRVWVEANLFEKDVDRIVGATHAEITTPSYPEVIFGGVLYNIGSTVDTGSRTITALFTVENREGRLKLDMTASIAVTISHAASVLAVPRDAVVQSGLRTVVFVHTAPERFAVRDVTLGTATGGGYVEIAGGLHAGDRVLTTGTYQVRAAAGL